MNLGAEGEAWWTAKVFAVRKRAFLNGQFSEVCECGDVRRYRLELVGFAFETCKAGCLYGIWGANGARPNVLIEALNLKAERETKAPTNLIN